jgi:type VI secretion system ImpA family protein
MDVEALLLPVEADSPAGPDLSYSPSRQSIEDVFATAPEDADWERAIALIEAEAPLTRDVWLAIYLARAGARAGRLDVVEQGMDLLAGLFERFWDSVHPTLDEYGIEGRKGACESLVRIGEFLAPLARVPLAVHPRLGSFSGADFERFAENGPAEPGYGQFRAAVADTSPEQLAEVVQQLRRIAAAVERADSVLSLQAEAAGQTGTNFQPTYAAIDRLIAAVSPFAGQPDGAAGDGGGTSDAAVPLMSAAVLGRLNSRADVERALDAVVEYYRRAEPSSPVPVALERIKGWIAMDFLQILDDISPGGMSDATNVLRGRGRDGGSDLM